MFINTRVLIYSFIFFRKTNFQTLFNTKPKELMNTSKSTTRSRNQALFILVRLLKFFILSFPKEDPDYKVLKKERLFNNTCFEPKNFDIPGIVYFLLH